MTIRQRPWGDRVRQAGLRAGAALGRVEVLALFPVLALTAQALGFDDLALVTAFGLSGLLAVSAVFGRVAGAAGLPAPAQGAIAGSGRPGLTAMLEHAAAQAGQDTACFLLQIDDWPALADRWGHDTCQHIVARVEDRLRATARAGDLVVRLGDARFGIGLAPVGAARLGPRDAIATRLALAVAEPVALNGTVLRLTASIGHTALIRRGADPAAATFLAAEAALGEALAHGPGAIRAYAPGLGRARVLKASLGADVEAALHAGEIRAWFQPQVCACTGAVTGMETLARWQHPRHGLLGSAEFLDAVDKAGALPLLGRSLTHQALKALHGWDRGQAHVAEVSIHLSAVELRAPDQVATLSAEVARYGLDPSRIRLAIGEDVVSRTRDDTIMAALLALRAAGHPVDLDGFGLGTTSIAVLQRIGIDRIRIARSFVPGVEADDGNRAAVAAIVAMAAALGLRTLAAGVETPQERETLVALGCDALQGFGIAKPMTGEVVADWARARRVAGKTIVLADRRGDRA